MKRTILLTIGIIASFIINAQNSDFFNYQAIIRDASGNAKVNANVTILIEIIQGSVSGSVVFNETHSTTTNGFGLVNLIIGSVNPSGFSSIDWSNSTYFIRVSVDGTVMGTNQLLSVPFALYAKKTESYTETDPIFLGHPSYNISSTNISNWDIAYSWGNHATAGYLTSFTETDPIFITSVANGISSTNILNWNTAYSWGNHATAGYLTSFTETDPIFATSAANGISLTNISNWNTAYSWGNHATAGYLTSFTETDPIFATSVANGISLTNISNWNTAYSWGNHAGLYKPISYLPDWNEITNNPINVSSPLNNQLLKYSTTSSKWENWTPDYLTTETQSLSLNTNQLTISGAGGNTVTFTNWDTDKTDDVTLSSPASGDMLYFNGTSWTAIPKGNTGQVLTMGSSGAPEWQNSIKILTTAATFNVSTTPVTATLNGIVNPNNITTTVTFEYGTTTSYGSSVTAAQSPVSGTSDVNVTFDLTSLTPGTLYHFRVKTVNAFGTLYGNDMSFTLLGIGITWEGGLIFYLDNSGQHGLVAASTDQGSATWGCLSTSITGADGTIVGTGNQNTTDIVNGCSTAGIAAKICYDLVLNSYSDWFLPSKDELGLMYSKLHQAGKGGFSSVNYWSSSESSGDYAFKQNFSTGSAGTSTKDVSYNVRAARAF